MRDITDLGGLIQSLVKLVLLLRTPVHFAAAGESVTFCCFLPTIINLRMVVET